MDRDCKIESKPRTFRELMMSAYFWTPATAVISGGILGYLYYHFVGCTSGSCAITNDPFLSIITGGFLGLAFVNRPCKTC
jgi:hypothetical protein